MQNIILFPILEDQFDEQDEKKLTGEKKTKNIKVINKYKLYYPVISMNLERYFMRGAFLCQGVVCLGLFGVFFLLSFSPLLGEIHHFSSSPSSFYFISFLLKKENESVQCLRASNFSN